ncbi:MAG: hypothetical protein ACI867_001930 [Glaciecola sp.]|jgi:hypothetical protein
MRIVVSDEDRARWWACSTSLGPTLIRILWSLAGGVEASGDEVVHS